MEHNHLSPQLKWDRRDLKLFVPRSVAWQAEDRAHRVGQERQVEIKFVALPVSVLLVFSSCSMTSSFVLLVLLSSFYLFIIFLLF